jgi:chromosome transmission fidelity protein 4
VGIPLKKKTDPLLFDDEGDDDAKKDGGLDNKVADDDYGMDNEDWMIDDIGLLDKPEEKDRADEGFAREMGALLWRDTQSYTSIEPSATQ